MYPIYLINFTVDTLVSIVEVRKIGEVVGDIALEGISELKDIVWGVFEEGIELVLVVNLNLAFSSVLPKNCSAHLSRNGRIDNQLKVKFCQEMDETFTNRRSVLSTRRMQDCQLKIEPLSTMD